MIGDIIRLETEENNCPFRGSTSDPYALPMEVTERVPETCSVAETRRHIILGDTINHGTVCLL